MNLTEYKSRSAVRRFILKHNLLSYICAVCGQEPFWNGRPLSLILDHINGVNNDHRLENLRFVCPNCNIQLPTYGSKNHNKRQQKKQKVLYLCEVCNKHVKVSKKARSCRGCMLYQKYATIWPACSELKNLVLQHGYLGVGRLIGVSDGAVRKRVKKCAK